MERPLEGGGTSLLWTPPTCAPLGRPWQRSPRSLRVSLALVAAAAAASVLPVCLARELPIVNQGVNLIWPTLMWTIPFKLSKNAGEAEERREKLVSVVEEAFQRYTTEILPKEFSEDSAYREKYEAADGMGNRDVEGFLRWQKAAFSRAQRRPLDELNWDGAGVPMYERVSYDWDFYASKDYKRFLKNTHSWIKRYAESSHGEGGPPKYSIFAWAEVYRPGDHHEPIARTGATGAGIYAAKFNGLQDLVFVDERGYAPPHGRKHSAQLAQGEMMLFPSWATNLLTPNGGNSSNVFFRFWISMPDGVNDFDWEDDPLGSFVKSQHNRLKIKDIDAGRPAEVAKKATPSERRGGEL